MKRLATMILLLSAGSLPTVAWDHSPNGPTDRIYDQKSLHVRYPGDKAYPFGTVHVKGGKKTPYIEKCYWTYQTGIFGLPRGFKQTCYRYTLENTRPQR